MIQRDPFPRFKLSQGIIGLAVMMWYAVSCLCVLSKTYFTRAGNESSHETFRILWDRFGAMFVAEIRGKRFEALRAHRHWLWYLGEVHVKINGVTHVVWRAVDHAGAVPQSIVTQTRDRKAALSS